MIILQKLKIEKLQSLGILRFWFGKGDGAGVGAGDFWVWEFSSQRLFLGSKMILVAGKKSSGKQKYSI